MRSEFVLEASVLSILLITCATPIPAQGQSAEKASFEVASIKPGDPGDRRSGIHGQPGGRLNTENTSLRQLIQFAYSINDYQITGGPNWLAAAPFTIEAKPETPVPGTPAGAAQVRLMLQSLLADRFKLATHWETREGTVYELIIAKGGHKLRETDPAYQSQDLNGGSGQLTAKGVGISQLIGSLSRQLGRPIVDKTGLSGRFDFALNYTPEARDAIFGRPVSPDSPAPPDLSGTSIFTALQEQLGLKLESARGPIQVLVVDHAEKPIPN